MGWASEERGKTVFQRKAGTYFWDYGNCFLEQSRRAGAEIGPPAGEPAEKYPSGFRYPSYVEECARGGRAGGGSGLHTPGTQESSPLHMIVTHG